MMTCRRTWWPWWLKRAARQPRCPARPRWPAWCAASPSWWRGTVHRTPGRAMASREDEAREVAAELDRLCDALAGSVAALTAILNGSADAPHGQQEEGERSN